MNPLFEKIPLTEAMQIQAEQVSVGHVRLTAPLKPNRNDKQTAFAGSTYSLLVLAGWGAVESVLKENKIEADVLAVQAEIRYLKPACADLTAEADLADPGPLLHALDEKGRGRIQLQPRLFSNGELCATLDAHYAVIEK